MSTPLQVIAAVSFATGIPEAVITGPSRPRSAAYARFLAFTLMKETTPWITLSVMGNAIGGRDHGTAIYGLRRAADLMVSDVDFLEAYTKAKSHLKTS